MTQASNLGAVPTGSGAQVRQDFNACDQALATEHEGPFAPSITYPFMRWRNDTGKLIKRRNAANSAWEIVENYGASTDPTTGDDAADGWVRGALWLNVGAGRVFFCADPTTGAAVWTQAGGSGGVSSAFGRTGAVVKAVGDYTADDVTDTAGKVMMTAGERTTLAQISFPAKVIPLAGTGSNSDNAAIRAAIAAIKASGQPGEILMSGDFKIGHGGDLTGIDPDSCPYLKLTGRGSCRWYKGVAATTLGMTGGFDPEDGTAYRLLGRDIDDGAGKTLIISNMIFEGDLGTTMKQLGDGSRLIALDNYDRVELTDVEGRWGSQMGFTFGYCNQVRANRIRLDHIARDGFNASNCADVAVTDSDFEFIIDDCCAANLSAVAADDPGQQRAFRFLGNRVFQCQGVKLLGGKHVLIAGNSFRVPFNYAVFLGGDDSYGEGARAIEDVLVYGNSVTDLVTADQVGNVNTVDTAIIVSQFSATPRNVVIRGNTLAQRTATNGSTWSALKLHGIAGENRQWRLDATFGDLLWYDPTLVGEIFVGQGKAVRIEAPNGLDRLTYDIDDNRFDGFSDDDVLRSQPMWDGTQSWAVPLLSTEFPVGAPARATGIDLRGYLQIRLVVSVGGAGGLADTVLSLRYSLDGGVSWADSGAELALTGAGDETNWGGWADIPDTLRQSIDVQLAMFGSNGNGSTAATITSIGVDVKNVDQTSAARLLPMQVLPAEKLAADGTALRSYSPQDIADIGFAATPAPTVRTGTSYTLALADNHRLVECANAAAITVTVPTDAAVDFPLGARIEIAQTAAGQITVSGGGVTLRLPAGKTAKTRLQYSVIVLTKRTYDEWILSGDLA